MKHNKSFTTFIITLLFFVSFQSSAGLNDATWYVSIDVDQIENNEIFKALDKKANKSSDDFHVRLENMPKEISYISLYGNATGSEDATAVIHGDFSQFSINDHIINFLYTQDDVSKLIKESTITYKNHEIQVLEVDDYEGQPDDRPKEAYFANVSNQITVISFQLDEVKNWLNHDYDSHDIVSGSLFSVEVDVQSALAHMGVNMNDNNHMMQSEIFQKVTQASASISEVNSEMVAEAALTTDDEATAIQIEQVINGLVAMSNLSGANAENELHATIMQNLKIQRTGNNILISTYASVEDFKKMALQKDTNSNDDGYKIELKAEL